MELDSQLSNLIAHRVSQQRAGLGLSLEELATRTGVSRAMISRIERGEVHASAVVLDRLCAGLGMTLSGLFARETATPLARRSEQAEWRDPQTGYLRRDVSPAGTGSPVNIVEVEFPAGAEVRLGRSRHRSIEQHVWVLDGAIEIELPDGKYTLETGDCLHMRPDRGITFRNLSAEPSRYAVIVTMEPQA